LGATKSSPVTFTAAKVLAAATASEPEVSPPAPHVPAPPLVPTRTSAGLGTLRPIPVV